MLVLTMAAFGANPVPSISTKLNNFSALLNPGRICPHPQPFSPRRRELEFMFPLLGERARVRVSFAIHPAI